jgi:hypothetical protein
MIVSRGAAKENVFRRSAAETNDALSIPGLTPLGYIFSPLRGYQKSH